MLNILQTKHDALTWLYTLGEGLGVPKGAVEYLGDCFEFRRQSKPTSTSVFEIRNSDTGQVLKSESPPRFEFTMTGLGDKYKPELDDFELKVELPAVAYGHYEAGFDRSGDFKLAFFSIKPLAQLPRPQRFSAHSRMHGVLSQLSADDLGMTQEAYQARCDWFDSSDEVGVRRALTEHFGKDFTSDEALEPWLTGYLTEFKLFHVFLQGMDYAELERRVSEGIKRRA